MMVRVQNHFKGEDVLIDEKDFEDEMKTYFASAYFEENLEEIYYCVFIVK